MVHHGTAGPAAPEPASFGAFPLQLHRLDGPVRASFGFIRDASFGQLDGWARHALGPAESAGLRRCKTTRRELSYLAGRFAARQAVALYLNGHGDQAFEVSSGVFNQPIVRCPGFEPPAITISHTDDLAVAIAHDAGHVMGVDVEQVRVFGRATADSFLTGAERRLAAALPGDEPRQLTVVWTIKEALSKALRCGLTVPLGILEISGMDIDRRGCVRSDFSNFQQYKCRTWVLRTHVLSIAMPRSTDATFDGAALG